MDCQDREPAVSVLMCVYNTKEEWLREAIESILKQTFRDFQFIIVLDCPTDGSEQVVRSYAGRDDRITVVKNEENLGLTKSLNRGLAVAKGKYIARMDSDDVSLPNRLEMQYRYMEANPGTVVVGARVFTPGLNQAVIYEWTGDQQALKIRLLFHNYGVPHPTAFIRRSVLTDHGITYTEWVKKSQDYKLWVDLLPYGDIIMLPDILLMYRVHENQITANPTSQRGFAHRIALEQAEALLGEMSEQERLIHCWFDDPKHIEGGRKGYKAYIRRMIEANAEKGIYDQQKLVRELSFMWCQKAWRRAVLMHKFDFFMDPKTVAMLKPSMVRYIRQNKKAKADYLEEIRKAQAAWE